MVRWVCAHRGARGRSCAACYSVPMEGSLAGVGRVLPYGGRTGGGRTGGADYGFNLEGEVVGLASTGRAVVADCSTTSEGFLARIDHLSDLPCYPIACYGPDMVEFSPSQLSLILQPPLPFYPLCSTCGTMALPRSSSYVDTCANVLVALHRISRKDQFQVSTL